MPASDAARGVLPLFTAAIPEPEGHHADGRGEAGRQVDQEERQVQTARGIPRSSVIAAIPEGHADISLIRPALPSVTLPATGRADSQSALPPLGPVPDQAGPPHHALELVLRRIRPASGIQQQNSFSSTNRSPA